MRNCLAVEYYWIIGSGVCVCLIERELKVGKNMSQHEHVVCSRQPETVAVLGTFDWNFDDVICALEPEGYEVIPVRTSVELEELLATDPNIEWFFVVHWREIIKPSLLDGRNFIGFHTGILPRDRGGSPIQHQVMRGQYKSEVCAFALTSAVDNGPVFLRTDIDMSTGNIDEILQDISKISATLIKRILLERPQAVEQTGAPSCNRRRTPEQSEVLSQESIISLYDFIRVLDGESYPKAFIRSGNIRIEFSQATLEGDNVVARAVLKVESDERL
jgi:methionyl-tRNA formyltransferase